MVGLCSNHLKVEEDVGKAGKHGYVNFKHVVWHKSFYLMLESIMSISSTGSWFRCGDDIVRHLFPYILILSADYEEQFVCIF